MYTSLSQTSAAQVPKKTTTQDIGFMPAFRDALSDAQIAELAGYMRARFAPQAAPWTDLPTQVARVRAAP